MEPSLQLKLLPRCLKRICFKSFVSSSKHFESGPTNILYLEQNFLVGGCRFFVNDVISEVVLGSFWLMLPA